MMFYLKLSHRGERGLILEPFPYSWVPLGKQTLHSGVAQTGHAAPLRSMSGMVGNCPLSLPAQPVWPAQFGTQRWEVAGNCESAVLHAFRPGPKDIIVHHIASGLVPLEWVSKTPPSLPPCMSQWRLFFLMCLTSEGQLRKKGTTKD